MSNLNKVLLMGRLTRDPELRYTPQGVPVAEIGLAINREFGGGQGGERRKETTFVDVTLWRRQAEVVCQYMKKGGPIFIEGRLRFDSWETQDGQRRSKLRVEADNFQFVGSRGEGGGGSQGSHYTEYEQGSPPDAGGNPVSAPSRSSGDGGGDSSWPEHAGPQEKLEENDIPF